MIELIAWLIGIWAILSLAFVAGWACGAARVRAEWYKHVRNAKSNAELKFKLTGMRK